MTDSDICLNNGWKNNTVKSRSSPNHAKSGSALENASSAKMCWWCSKSREWQTSAAANQSGLSSDSATVQQAGTGYPVRSAASWASAATIAESRPPLKTMPRGTSDISRSAKLLVSDSNRAGACWMPQCSEGDTTSREY